MKVALVFMQAAVAALVLRAGTKPQEPQVMEALVIPLELATLLEVYMGRGVVAELTLAPG